MLEAQAVQDAGESSQEFTVGVRGDKACPPFSSPPFPLSKKGEDRSLALPLWHTENCPNFSSFISSADRFKSNLFVAYTTCDLGSVRQRGDANFVTF